MLDKEEFDMNEKQALMERAYARIKADYDTLEREWLRQEPKHLIDHAYEIAHLYEAYYFLENELTNTNPEDCRYNEDELETIANFGHGNTVTSVYEEWLHGCYEDEYTNYFYWGDLGEIINWALFGRESR